MIPNSQNLRNLYIGWKAAFMGALRGDSTAEWPRIATKSPSSTAAEEYGFLDNWPKFRKWVGDRILKQLGAHDYTIKNEDYESSITVPINAVKDDNLGMYSEIFASYGVAAAQWPDDMIFALLLLGETENGYDKVPYFGNHTVGGAVVSNLDAGASTPWYLFDTKKSLKPLIYQEREAPTLVPKDKPDDDNVFYGKKLVYGAHARGAAGFGLWQLAHKAKVALDKAGFEAAKTAMRERTNDEGETLKIVPNLIVVPPSLEGAARDLFVAERDANGATNTLKGAVEILVSSNLV